MTQEQARELIGRTWDLTLDLLEPGSCPRPAAAAAAGRVRRRPGPLPALLAPGQPGRQPLFAGITGPRLWQALTALDDSGLIDLAPAVGPAPSRSRGCTRSSATPAARHTGPRAAGLLALAAGLLGRAAARAGLPEDPAMWAAGSPWPACRGVCRQRA